MRKKKRKMLRRKMSLIQYVNVILLLLLKYISHEKIRSYSGIAISLQSLSTINRFSNR